MTQTKGCICFPFLRHLAPLRLFLILFLFISLPLFLLLFLSLPLFLLFFLSLPLYASTSLSLSISVLPFCPYFPS